MRSKERRGNTEEDRGERKHRREENKRQERRKGKKIK